MRRPLFLDHGGEQRAIMVYQFDSYRYWEQKLGDRTSPGAFSAKTSRSMVWLTAKSASATGFASAAASSKSPSPASFATGSACDSTHKCWSGAAPGQRCLAMPRNPLSLMQWPGDTRTRGSAIYLCSKCHEPSQSAAGGSCFRQLMRFANIMDG